MAKQRRNRSPAAGQQKPGAAGDTLTIGWMLSVCTTLVCEIAALVAQLVAARLGEDAIMIALFADVLLFAALVFGVISLAMMAAVMRFRPEPVPRGVLVFATVVSLAPWGVLALARWL